LSARQAISERVVGQSRIDGVASSLPRPQMSPARQPRSAAGRVAACRVS
jgi:hypothetical protein